MMHAYETLVLLRDGEFQLTGLIPELQAVFAPVESANEALSYALAATGLYARYGIETHECTSVDCYLADTIEDTHVDETEGGYVVHLFSDYEPPCGCGTHITCAVRVSVTREGQISQARTRLHRFEACLD